MEERHTEQEGSSPASNTPDSPVTSSEKPPHLSGSPPAARAGVEEPEAEPVPKGPLMFTFSGKTGEFFKIWIVNILLTICTVGIYSAWAKVRTKRYFYGNTSINGDSFAYHANPLSILIARLIVAALVIGGVYWLGQTILGKAVYLTFLSFFLPWALVRGFAFNARNSSYRNIRFSFQKKYLPLYLIYSPYIISFLLAGWIPFFHFTGDATAPVLMEGTVGEEDPKNLQEVLASLELALQILAASLLLIVFASPFFLRAYHRYKAEKHSLGDIPFSFGGVGLRGYFLIIGKVILLLITLILLVLAGHWFIVNFVLQLLLYQPLPDEVSLIAITAIIYIVVIFLIPQYIGACLFSIFWQNLKFEGGHSDCTIKPLTFFFKILLVNALAIVFSLGLLYPWAKIRRSRYVAEHLSVRIEDAAVLSRIKRAKEREEGALGEEFEAVEGFDFDIGLV
jgi:uncharacterized membrane protein YjgN (DUF898 family)